MPQRPRRRKEAIIAWRLCAAIIKWPCVQRTGNKRAFDFMVESGPAGGCGRTDLELFRCGMGARDASAVARLPLPRQGFGERAVVLVPLRPRRHCVRTAILLGRSMDTAARLYRAVLFLAVRLGFSD